MISVQSLRVEFGARVLFNDLAFSVQPRERIAFAGHNGAGKSTLMKCVAGLILFISHLIMTISSCPKDAGVCVL